MSEILPLSPANRRYGAFKGNPNHPARKLYAAPQPYLPIPRKFDLWKFMGPIRDQGNEGSCTGQAGAANRDLLYRKQYEWEKDKTVPPDQFTCSASFVYKNNLIADGDLGHDVGSSLHQTIITLNRYGSCLESQEPYSDRDYKTPPNAQQYAEALTYKGGAYHFLPNLDTMRHCIASGYSFVFGIEVYDSFESDWPEKGMMPMPDLSRESLLGGHAQHVLAYDDDLEFPDGNIGGLGIQNSWGADWQNGGCYWMPYKFVTDGHTDDAWIMHLGPAWG